MTLPENLQTTAKTLTDWLRTHQERMFAFRDAQDAYEREKKAGLAVICEAQNEDGKPRYSNDRAREAAIADMQATPTTALNRLYLAFREASAQKDLSAMETEIARINYAVAQDIYRASYFGEIVRKLQDAFSEASQM